MKVLLAVDGSAYTRRMLEHLGSHPDLLGKVDQFVALTVVAAIPPHAARHVGRNVVDEYYQDQAKEILGPVVEYAKEKGWNLETRHEAGHAADLIAEAANNGGFGLLVMGTHGHSSLSGLVMGSVTSKTIAQTKLPVLLIR